VRLCRRAWFDIQKQPPTAEAARAAYPGGQAVPHDGSNSGGPPTAHLIIAATLLLAGSALADTFSPLFEPRLGERQELKARKTYGQAEGVRENALHSLYHFPNLESCFLGNLAFVHLENVDEAHFDIRSNG
jgi:hypothetical protein